MFLAYISFNRYINPMTLDICIGRNDLYVFFPILGRHSESSLKNKIADTINSIVFIIYLDTVLVFDCDEKP